jgi:murein L,D-transpeptidase YcbB/YkuD
MGLTVSKGSKPASGFSRRRTGHELRRATVMRATRWVFHAVLIFAIGAQAAVPPPDQDVAAAIQTALAPRNASALRPQNHAEELPPEQRLYRDRRYAGLWTHGSKMTPQGQQLLVLLSRSEDLGLKLDDYGVEPLMAAGMRLAGGAATPEATAAFDIRLTQSALRFIHDAHYGRIDPRQVGFELPTARTPFDPTATLLVHRPLQIGGEIEQPLEFRRSSRQHLQTRVRRHRRR